MAGTHAVGIRDRWDLPATFRARVANAMSGLDGVGAPRIVQLAEDGRLAIVEYEWLRDDIAGGLDPYCTEVAFHRRGLGFAAVPWHTQAESSVA
jgi:hypothetical protein